MILESIVTTHSRAGQPNVAPMGPLFDGHSDCFELRPFSGSQTLANLTETKQGILHITDDVKIFAEAAVRKMNPLPEMVPATVVEGSVLVNACRWYEFEVTFQESSTSRASLQCQIVHSGRMRDFYGFNRAKSMVIEAAILATRVHFLPVEEVSKQFVQFEKVIAKTGGADEFEAFEMLKDYVNSCSAKDSLSGKSQNG